MARSVALLSCCQKVGEVRDFKYDHIADLAEGVTVAVDVGKVPVAVALAVDEAALVVLDHDARVLVLHLVAILLRHALADDDVARVDERVLRHEAGGVELVIVVRLQRARRLM
jgi:hypothetical protein